MIITKSLIVGIFVLFGILFLTAHVFASSLYGNADDKSNSNVNSIRLSGDINISDSDDLNDSEDDANDSASDDSVEDDNRTINKTIKQERDDNKNKTKNVNKTKKTEKDDEKERIRERIISKINNRTGFNISLAENDSDAPLGAILRAYLSNGRFAYIKILPENASIRAIEKAKAKCEANNCTVELKEVSINRTKYAVYQVTVEKETKLFGFIKRKVHFFVSVDAETGNVIVVKKPWWAVFSREQDENVTVSGNSSAGVNNSSNTSS